MADTIFVKPVAGRRVKDPTTLRLLADGGESKPRNSYWLRRLSDGDVVEVTPAAVPAVVAELAPKPSKKSPAPLTTKTEA